MSSQLARPCNGATSSLSALRPGSPHRAADSSGRVRHKRRIRYRDWCARHGERMPSRPRCGTGRGSNRSTGSRVGAGCRSRGNCMKIFLPGKRLSTSSSLNFCDLAWDAPLKFATNTLNSATTSLSSVFGVHRDCAVMTSSDFCISSSFFASPKFFTISFAT